MRSSTEEWAKIFLFKTHVCIEQPAILMFTRKTVVPLTDVLGLLYPDGGSFKRARPSKEQVGSSPASPAGGGGGGGTPSVSAVSDPATAVASGALRTVDLQMKGGSIRLAMEPKQLDAFAREVREAAEA